MARRARGFTLVEVLVALFVMAVMAAMAWQGVDGVVRAKQASEARVDRVLRLATVLAQWEQDLNSVEDSDLVPPLAFDGSTLRMTRRAEGGMQVVAWSLHDGTLLRWLGPQTTSAQTLQEAWLRSLQLNGREPEQLRAVAGVSQWQVYFFRGNAWTNAQSSGDIEAPAPAPPASAASGAAAAPRTILPSGVRLVLAFAPGSGESGELTRDVRLGPQIQ